MTDVLKLARSTTHEPTSPCYAKIKEIASHRPLRRRAPVQRDELSKAQTNRVFSRSCETCFLGAGHPKQQGGREG